MSILMSNDWMHGVRTSRLGSGGATTPTGPLRSPVANISTAQQNVIPVRTPETREDRSKTCWSVSYGKARYSRQNTTVCVSNRDAG